MADVGLDLATKTGVAICDGGRIETIAWQFIGDHPASRFVGLRDALACLSDDYDVQRVSIELPARLRSGPAIAALYGLQAVALMWCFDHGYELHRFQPSQVKRHATGNGRAKKADMYVAARRRWPDVVPESYDVSDAMWVLDMLPKDADAES